MPRDSGLYNRCFAAQQSMVIQLTLSSVAITMAPTPSAHDKNALSSDHSRSSFLEERVLQSKQILERHHTVKLQVPGFLSGKAYSIGFQAGKGICIIVSPLRQYWQDGCNLAMNDAVPNQGQLQSFQEKAFRRGFRLRLSKPAPCKAELHAFCLRAAWCARVGRGRATAVDVHATRDRVAVPGAEHVERRLPLNARVCGCDVLQDLLLCQPGIQQFLISQPPGCKTCKEQTSYHFEFCSWDEDIALFLQRLQKLAQ